MERQAEEKEKCQEPLKAFFFFFRDKGSSQMKELPVVALGQ